ncbi:MAG: hypothetical protein SVR04_06900 [Spirochaetota bacterium]|nr:hypothetical protein [Spirochaetota bacterium]
MKKNLYRGKTMNIVLLILIYSMTFFLAGCGRPDTAGESGAPEGPGPGEPQPLAVEALRVTRG